MMENNIQKMPALFVGHGNPMNAIDDNKFTQTWQLIGESIPFPKLFSASPLTGKLLVLTSRPCKHHEPFTILEDFHGHYSMWNIPL